MKASVMLQKSSNYELVDLSPNSNDPNKSKLLILRKVTETGAPFIVVVGYFQREVQTFGESFLAEIETAPVEDYPKLKEIVRRKFSVGSAKVPITFW